MSFLRNPSFENGTKFWETFNFPDDVTFSVVKDSSKPAPLSGSRIARMVTTEVHGSVCQDVTVDAPSVSAFAYVTSDTGADGVFTIWNLDSNTSSAVPFKIKTPFAWQLVTNTLDLDGIANASVRVEFYLDTKGAELFVDNVNLF